MALASLVLDQPLPSDVAIAGSFCGPTGSLHGGYQPALRMMHEERKRSFKDAVDMRGLTHVRGA